MASAYRRASRDFVGATRGGELWVDADRLASVPAKKFRPPTAVESNARRRCTLLTDSITRLASAFTPSMRSWRI